MTVSTEIKSGDRVAAADPRGIPCLCLPTASGTPGTPVTLSPGDDVDALIGGGRAAAWVLLLHAATGSDVVVSPSTAAWTALSGTLTKSGSGPDITIGNAAGCSGALDDLSLKLVVASAGALGTAAVDVYLDGHTLADSILTPQEGPAVVTGAVDIEGSVPAMNGLTLVFTDPSSTTITFASSPSTAELLVDAFNTLAVSGSLAVRARVREQINGKKRFELYSVAVGEAAEITISSSSTGEATLGLATTTAAGTAASITLPATGARLTFAAGTYALADTYAKSLTGPASTLAAQRAAAQAARDAFRDHPFGFLVFDAQVSHVNAATLAGQVGADVATWLADESAPAFVDFVTGTALHTASSSKTTNKANITTNDTAFTSAIGSLDPDPARNFAHDDAYFTNPAGQAFGTFRRSAALAGAIRRASLDRIAGNPGQYLVPLAKLLGPDGVTEARDESSSTIKLGKLSGKAWCLRSTAAGPLAAKFAPCANGAGSGSRLRDPGVYAISLSLAAALFAEVELWEGESWETDPESPAAASEDETTARADALADALALVAKPKNRPQNVSGDLRITVSGANVLNDGDVIAGVVFNPLAVVEDITIAITATGVAISEG